MASNAELIHQKTVELLETVGFRYMHPEAQQIVRDHGIRMEGDIAFFTGDQLMEWVSKAPSQFTIYARDPKFNMELGTGKTHLGPAMGMVKIVHPDGSYTAPTLDDVIKADKLYEANDSFYVNGGCPCTPNDVPIEFMMEFHLYAGLMLSGKVPPDVCGPYRVMENCMDILAASFGVSKEELAEKPRILGGINVDSPLRLDLNMTETLFTYLKYRQPCYIAPAAMAGSTSPVTVAGTIVQTNAEVLATIALAQMVAPGAPVLYASQSVSSDMKTLASATGSPESALCYRYAGIMGQYYNIPVRSGGAVSDSKKCDVQAGYESTLCYLACRDNKVDVVLHGAGFCDAYLTLSYEKIISDYEIIGYVNTYLNDIEVNDLTVPLDTMAEVGHDDSFMMCDHTLENFSDALYTPIISARGPAAASDAIEKNTQARIEEMLAAYRSPEINQSCIDACRVLLEGIGVDPALITRIEDARVI